MTLNNQLSPTPSFLKQSPAERKRNVDIAVASMQALHASGFYEINNQLFITHTDHDEVGRLHATFVEHPYNPLEHLFPIEATKRFDGLKTWPEHLERTWDYPPLESNRFMHWGCPTDLTTTLVHRRLAGELLLELKSEDYPLKTVVVRLRDEGFTVDHTMTGYHKSQQQTGRWGYLQACPTRGFRFDDWHAGSWPDGDLSSKELYVKLRTEFADGLRS